MAGEKILVVDDEEHIVKLIKFNLENNGYKVITAADGGEALEKAKGEVPQLVLLDLMLPVMDGYDVCREIRRDQSISNMPVIMITAKGEELDKILGLELGADDYITKPFSVRELVARVKAVLRRTKVDYIDKTFKFGNIQIDFQRHNVTKEGEKVELTLKEFELLQVLIKNKGRVMTRDFLLDKIWGYEYIGETRTVDVHVRHLRQKIEDDDKNPKYIETIRGIGYRFNYSGD
ncbi:two-component system alkaline phosphatase synthesis response regulator PhoP [Clostridium acetobutylicum]|uniref:Stage 0 sporulation protein A homolog n=1 Tax=Clostridium acetobutylicum (strain ATCC 824 / DSM 792 / JCM 1419 / IAM 19013 / LMG 5710 / NBRC 13948 / NRRL B-527 / VKM B-1787 / 2291 / W) TaxID=272562 RepID=Q97IE8_CLOAB|nr:MULTISPECIES: response regulator transcription factor [Clostridium]AAK79666.1 Response regulator (CheY-like receiver domain and DNA-binding HTH domain) [Clostridium acetobutylicum ATCC 824]ADZ20750.1 Response regulator (CheY-like receiver domain and DNA-binding HTH domain) [Clostridium acetobutylicum EA 2018]AEI34740.1 response regulator [Clostridium acetobutylicum DSM 1731]AWV79898.1 DNA-binding response regulator [Clostridium acetobutylicum]KHD37997.1 ArsR family transcriptional regulator